MRLSMYADQALYFVMHHPMATVAIAGAIGALSWVLTRASAA
jgi:hypothetical protein